MRVIKESRKYIVLYGVCCRFSWIYRIDLANVYYYAWIIAICLEGASDLCYGLCSVEELFFDRYVGRHAYIHEEIILNESSAPLPALNALPVNRLLVERDKATDANSRQTTVEEDGATFLTEANHALFIVFIFIQLR